MTLVASAQKRQLVTRHILFVQCEGVRQLPPLGEHDVAVADGGIALRCAGSEMTATVTVERHDGPPAAPPAPWRVREEAPWPLSSGRVGVTDLDGGPEWLPDVGLSPGVWQVRVSSAGSEKAEELEDAMYEDEDAEITQMIDGPERWLVQVWQ
jgi:hypothetical protein